MPGLRIAFSTPCFSVTLEQGVEKAIRSLAPKVGEILDTTDHAAGRNPYYAPAK